MRGFSFSPQLDTADCGPACLKMIADYYGKSYSLDYLREKCYLTREGVSLPSISEASEKLGFRTVMAKLDLDLLAKECPLPCILHWNQEHFVVLCNIKESMRLKGGFFPVKNQSSITIADPGHGIMKVDRATFEKAWISSSDQKGVALILEPTPEFYSRTPLPQEKRNRRFLIRYLYPYKKQLMQLLIGMLATSLIALVFPFLTKIVVDYGVAERNMSVLWLVLLSQLFLFLGSTALEVVRSWLLLHVNTRISLNIISDFLQKLLRLPIQFFDSKGVGDIAQRINDHHRVENFLTGVLLNSLFSIMNLIVFTIVLAFFDWKILAVFSLLSIFGVGWIFLFQARRKQLDYRRFARNRENQDKLYEMITGMQEIKLYGSETSKRWEWEQLQVKSFKLNIKSLALEQYQQTGFSFFTHLKNILISFLAAQAAIEGQMTIGTLLSISFIIGQTNAPLSQLTSLIKALQDARLSMDRLQEIHAKKDEEESERNEGDGSGFPVHDHIELKNVSFQYEGPHSPFVLNDINLCIPKGKVTAIVGTSGSGKTTLMKLLLKFYNPVSGKIAIGERDVGKISPKWWRNQCGTVLQDGYIFYDSIARNIALDGQPINEDLMEHAAKVANLTDFISQLPLGYSTKIGNSGIGISGGQKQRILIARAVYKNPDYLFFDEATSALDANNEKIIMENLQAFFKGRTVVVIAHRLSTVKNADQIVVMEQGRVVEMGNHMTLTRRKGKYFELVKNQLELGN